MRLQRVLEPEVMDSADEARDYNQMDHAEVNRLFVEDLLASGFRGGDVLDVGTGTALIPIELCRRHPDCRVMAIDMAGHMLDLAKLNINVHEMVDRIQLAQIDAKQMDFADAMFDAVISNSIIHHLPEPILCLHEVVRIARPGALLFFRDLMRPESESRVGELVEEHAGGESDHARQMFADSLRAALSLDEMRALVTELGFRADSVQATSDRHWTWVATRSS